MLNSKACEHSNLKIAHHHGEDIIVMLRQMVAMIFLTIWVQTASAQTVTQVPCERKTFNLAVHCVRDYDSVFSRNLALIQQYMLPRMNSFFAPTCMQFSICVMDTIPDYNYADKEGDVLAKMYNKLGMINIYITSQNKDMMTNGICKDDTMYPYICYNLVTLDEVSFLRNLCLYFGLNFTYSQPINKELVNGSNALVTADSLYDTPADPYLFLPLSPSGSIDDTTVYTSGPSKIFVSQIKDANGNFYDPMMYNLMAMYDSGNGCKTLTREQYTYMVTNYRRCRNRRW
jgi:hypothetical protein